MEGDKLSTVKKKRTTKNNPEVEVSVNWRPIVGEPSASYRRLCRLLFKKRENPAGTHETTGRELITREKGRFDEERQAEK